MISTIYLCNVPFLNPTYEHVIDFENKANRDNYFTNLPHKEIKANIKYDSNRTMITVNMSLEEANNYDYLYYSGFDRLYFYFITSVEFCTVSTTNYYLQLDVFNTYFYDVQLMNSFVDRAHVDRWDGDIPTENYQDEGISIGEYVIQENPTVLSPMYNSVVIASSVPLGITENSTGSGGSDYGNVGGTSWKDGKISSQGFRFIKGYEGFCATEYQDSGGYWTIGYGITKHGEPDIYNELASKQPITEEEAGRVMYDVICKNYGSKILKACINLGVTEQYQFDALVSLAYNSGNGSITGSNSLTNVIGINPTDESSIRPVWESFKCTSSGIFLEGLRLRRIEECNMFLGQTFEIRPIQGVDGDGWLPNDSSNTEDDSSESINGYNTCSNDFGTGWLIPVKGATVSSPYGWRNCPYHGRELHPGIDLAIGKGTPILATKSGTVIRSEYHNSMGNHVYIEHANGIITKYMHMSVISVSVGDAVVKGQKIGEVGSTGNSTGNHLHWEFRNGDNESCIPIDGYNTKGAKP